MVRTMNGVTAAVDGTLGEIDLSTVTINNPGEVENRHTITVRVRVVAHYGGAAGDVRGEQRRVFSVTRDETVLPGFPIDVRGSGEASPHLVDLNGDGSPEVVATVVGPFVCGTGGCPLLIYAGQRLRRG